MVEQLRRAVTGGIGTYVHGLLQGLCAMGEAAPAVALHASRAQTRPDPLAALGPPLRHSVLPGPMLTRAWDRGLLGAPGPADVMHATSLAFPAPAKSPPLAVMVHDLAWRRVPEAYPVRGRHWHEAALQRAISGARLMVVPAASAAEDLMSAGVPAERIEIVEEGCDHLPPADTGAARALLDGLGVSDGFLLTVGTVQPRKNLRRLLEAYGLARPDLAEPWPLVVVGPDGWGNPIPDSAVPPGTVFAGEVRGATLAGLYRLSRCLAFVPLVEGFGLPPVEAMREGTPVVASPIPSTGGAALEVDPFDTAAMAAALVAAASDEPLRSELSGAGRRRTEGMTWQAAAARHVELWESLVR